MVRKKNKKNSKPTKEVLKKKNWYISGFICYLLGIIFLLSLFNTHMGVIGDFIKQSLTSLFGALVFVFPVILFVFGTKLLFYNNKKNVTGNLKNSFFILGIYLILLILLDVIHDTNLSFLERINAAYISSAEYKGGGVIGAIFGSIFYFLLGKVGTFIVFFFVLFLLIITLLNIPMSVLIAKIKVFLKAFQINMTDKFKKTDNGSDEEQVEYSDHTLSNPPMQPAVMTFKGKEASSQPDKPRELVIPINPFVDEIEEKAPKARSTENKSMNKTSDSKGKTDNSIASLKPKDVNTQTGEEVDSVAIKYKKPSIHLLERSKSQQPRDLEKRIKENGRKIEETLSHFGIKTKVKAINRGPTITCYELEPSPDVKLNKIVSLSDNLALTLASSNIRIEAPIPGKSLVGIEVPNDFKDNVSLREMIESKEFRDLKSSVPLVLGKDVNGKPIISEINKMPHLLISGATGSGKSVCINSIILSILYKADPEDVKLILIDPKVVELSIYNKIPHLLIPVVTDPQKAAYSLNWAVNEMEKRYRVFARNGVRDIGGYRKKASNMNLDKMPEIVVIIDELADLMMVASQDIEDYIGRLAQMARAAGIYMIVATQRPSVDVITGTIKANIPSRIAFSVSSQTDSRTILDMGGAEKLLGKGDMLFYPSFFNKPLRVQGCFVSDEEIEAVVNSIAVTNDDNFDKDVVKSLEKSKSIALDDSDPLLDEAIAIVIADQQASISYLQRKLKLGYSRAARIVDQLEERGIVSARDGTKPRNVLITQSQWEEMKDKGNEEIN